MNLEKDPAEDSFELRAQELFTEVRYNGSSPVEDATRTELLVGVRKMTFHLNFALAVTHLMWLVYTAAFWVVWGMHLASEGGSGWVTAAGVVLSIGTLVIHTVDYYSDSDHLLRPMRGLFEHVVASERGASLLRRGLAGARLAAASSNKYSVRRQMRREIRTLQRLAHLEGKMSRDLEISRSGSSPEMIKDLDGKRNDVLLEMARLSVALEDLGTVEAADRTQREAAVRMAKIAKDYAVPVTSVRSLRDQVGDRLVEVEAQSTMTGVPVDLGHLK